MLRVLAIIYDKNTIEFLGIWEEMYNLNFNEDEYNTQIDDIGFSRPIQITYFALYQGHKIGYLESDYWHFDKGLLLGKKFS